MPRRPRQADTAGTAHRPAAITPPVAPPVETEEARALRLDALYARIEEEPNAWRMVELIRDGNVPTPDRQRFLGPFFVAVARLTSFEAEAILAEARPVFHYRMETAREEVERQQDAGAGNITKFRCFVEGQADGRDFLADIIATADDTKPIKYLMYHPDNGETQMVDQIPMGNTLYMPPQATQMIETRVLLLPTEATPYRNDAELFQEIRTFIGDFVQVADEKMYNTLAFYVLLTWVFDRLDVVPYLRVIGDYGTGKTRLIKTVGQICYRPIIAGGATTASPIFRIIDRYKGTMVIDEADFMESDLWQEIVKILNQGYEPGGPVLRSERTADENFDVRAYDTFCPKILATREEYRDHALESRCLTYRMPRVELHRNIPSVLTLAFRQRALLLRNKLLSWRFQHYQATALDPYERIDGVEPRLNQIVLPLRAVVQDPALRHMMMEHILEHQERIDERRQTSDAGLIAQAFVHVWEVGGNPNRLSLKIVRDKMEAVHGWVSDKKSLMAASKKLAFIVRSFGFKTKESNGTSWALRVSPEEISRLKREFSLDTTITEPAHAPRLMGAPVQRTAVPPAEPG